MFFPVDDWFAAFAVTVLVEIPIIVVLLAVAERVLLRRIALALLANLASHPIVWFVLTQLLEVGSPAYIVAAEGWAVLVEAAVFLVAVRGLSARRAVTISLVANAASFLAGRLIRQVLPPAF